MSGAKIRSARSIVFEGQRYFRSTKIAEYGEVEVFVSTIDEFTTGGYTWAVLDENYPFGTVARRFYTNRAGEGLWQESGRGMADDRQLRGTGDFGLYGDRRAVRERAIKFFMPEC
ncbi:MULTISPECIES: hypothetical protein [unclassified Cryobacterium]|uniref:hypothetical protein n=1 Tax=unclassified Cryobacterium TaxID=2649013 RepID=UPI00106A4623|nr:MULTISPECIES: hypothetical protein [unclassified Cryobacterium]TFB96283.1 hypothetical protein E3O39_09255 [Cryobacterium sp. MDB2-A-1]TFC12568.1 hypothetical protein E3O35_06420 [Cryobacterium sp. MDB2-A-2]